MNYLSLVEVEVFSGSSFGGAIEWVVSDQLGTPRMEADKSGSLSGIHRHDYLPFGEELFAGSGGRTAAQGYVSDGVRQKFTGYERDPETGLDYAQARYYSNAQGRFTSIDPLMASAHPLDPKTWNRYPYALNNPLKYNDPTGLKPEDQLEYNACVSGSSGCGPRLHETVTVSIGNALETIDTTTTDLASLALNAVGTVQQVSNQVILGPFGAGVSSTVAEGLGTAQHFSNSAIGGRLYANFISDPRTQLAAMAALGIAGGFEINSAGATTTVTNPIPSTLSRIIAGEGPFTTLGRAGAADVFVTAADDIAGMSASQLGPRLGIPSSGTFTVIEFPTPSSGLASPILRTNPGFVGFGRTIGGAREFVIPNGPIPANAAVKVIK